MRGSILILGVVVLAGCGPKPYVGSGPAAKHMDISFRAVSTKLEFLSGETVRLAGYVKNEGKRGAMLLVDLDPRLGVKCTVELLGRDGAYTPILEAPKPRAEFTLDNSSFLVLDPGLESRVTVFDIRSAKGPDGKEGPLPPGTYTAKMRYEVAAEPAGAADLSFQGDAKKMLAQSPRAVWENSVEFKVSTEVFSPPQRRPRGGGPSGG